MCKTTFCIKVLLISVDISDYVPLVNLFGVYFQIRDDYMNLQSTEVRGHGYSILFNETDGRSLQRDSIQRTKGLRKTLLRVNFLSPSSMEYAQTRATVSY